MDRLEYLLGIHTFKGRSEDELDVERGDYIEVLEDDSAFNDSWYFGRNLTTFKTGLFPKAFTTNVAGLPPKVQKRVEAYDLEHPVDPEFQNQDGGAPAAGLQSSQPQNGLHSPIQSGLEQLSFGDSNRLGRGDNGLSASNTAYTDGSARANGSTDANRPSDDLHTHDGDEGGNGHFRPVSPLGSGRNSSSPSSKHPLPPLPHTVLSWSPQNVELYFINKGLVEDAPKFAQHRITGAILLEMDRDTLKEIDIVSFGPRYEIEKEIKALRQAAGFSPTMESPDMPGSPLSSQSYSNSIGSMMNTPVTQQYPQYFPQPGASTSTLSPYPQGAAMQNGYSTRSFSANSSLQASQPSLVKPQHSQSVSQLPQQPKHYMPLYQQQAQYRQSPQSPPIQSQPFLSQPIQSPPIQSQPFQSQPIQSQPIQSPPMQSSPYHYPPLPQSQPHLPPSKPQPHSPYLMSQPQLPQTHQIGPQGQYNGHPQTQFNANQQNYHDASQQNQHEPQFNGSQPISIGKHRNSASMESHGEEITGSLNSNFSMTPSQSAAFAAAQAAGRGHHRQTSSISRYSMPPASHQRTRTLDDWESSVLVPAASDTASSRSSPHRHQRNISRTSNVSAASTQRNALGYNESEPAKHLSHSRNASSDSTKQRRRSSIFSRLSGSPKKKASMVGTFEVVPNSHKKSNSGTVNPSVTPNGSIRSPSVTSPVTITSPATITSPKDVGSPKIASSTNGSTNSGHKDGNGNTGSNSALSKLRPTLHKMKTSAFQEGIKNVTAEQAAATASKAGWMHKRGGNGIGVWSKRYFTLHATRLSYFASFKDTKEKGLIDITGYRVVPVKDHELLVSLSAAGMGAGRHCFKLVPPGPGYKKGVAFTAPKVHYFAVESSEELREWQGALMSATIERDDSAPVLSTCQLPTISLPKAQELMAARLKAKGEVGSLTR